MYVSETSFTHLREAADQRQLRELENRRLAHERAAGTTRSRESGLHKLVQRFRHSAQPAPRAISHL
ncbi:hypothetical protein [Microbacterium sp. SS28]|uniref:hypothetical protein n=1 Tax=Microbacterium sp. SS28 TaxID=2919948 RepID=UPI001FAA210F|nr:hypothetical protein [Microbacterium sp. SS28]